MAIASAAVSVSEDWELEEVDAKPASLVVQLRRSAHVFPWFRFVCAEGDNSQIRITFASHLVTVTGNGLAALLAAISSQRVARIIQPSENEAKFGVRGPAANSVHGPCITDITVEEFR